MRKLVEKIQAVLTAAVENEEVAGANALVIRAGETAYAQAGFADVENGKPFARDTICRIYSMSKPVTAVAAMILVERGELDLGAGVGEYLPEFCNMRVWENGQKVPTRRNVLIKDLLGMTSGISYPAEDPSGREVACVFEELEERLYGNDPMTTRAWAKKIGSCALAFHPGEKWMYGASADVLGAVIEKVGGVSLREFMRREIFAPLGMTDTDFYVPAEKAARLAQIYERTGDGLKPFRDDNLGISYCADRMPAFQSGGAGLCSTIDDYAKLARSLMGEGVQLLKPQTVRTMMGNQLLPWQKESAWRAWESMAGYGYGNLCRVLTDPAMAMLNGWKGEYGWDGWLGTYFCNSPENDVTVLMFTQRKDAGTLPLTRKLRNVITANL